MSPSRLFTALLLVVLAIPPMGYGQVQDIREMADSLYGLDDLLVNGRIYTNPHPKANGHPFYPKAAFSLGEVNVKGEKFDEVTINYNAEQDELVLDVSHSMPWISYIVLNHNLVDSFRIGDRSFVHAHTLPPNPYGRLYLEKLFEGKFSLLASHEKVFSPDVNQWHPHGVFLEKADNLLLLKNNTFTDVTREKKWLNHFIDHKKDIKKYLKRNRINWKKANLEQLKQLADFCNGFYENREQDGRK